ncbi:Clavaminate synthase-like protein [Lentithecium fluviatile CBS 122367]|uniref:Clavaminate synthase-like protein n=1 Tax=Lentithecium fluviatile CBS 122367 TaxID=1168545 RepID=A0A6G1IVJ3_9PLEO|nr:Clavaminate synthase-like protein [Lentithecium fluviatile CBS 122367]
MESATRASFEIVPYAPAVDLPEPYPPKTTFPISLIPSRPTTSLSVLLSEIRRITSTGEIRRLLNNHGAIYFQKLDLASSDEFSQFAHAFGFVPHEGNANRIPRTTVAPNVSIADEGPNAEPVYPHNESELGLHYPAYVFLYSASAPETGGETPINSSIVLCHQLKARHPEFIEQLEKRGLRHEVIYAGSTRTPTGSLETSVLQVFGQYVLEADDTEAVRAKIEKEIKRSSTATFEWVNQSAENPLGDLRTWRVLPAIRPHPRTGLPAFFNNAVSWFLKAVDAGTVDPPHVDRYGQYRLPAYYGDGSLIPREYFESAVQFIRETRAAVRWEKGNVLLLDNHAVQHGREPWTGERKLLVSLWDLEDG